MPTDSEKESATATHHEHAPSTPISARGGHGLDGGEGTVVDETIGHGSVLDVDVSYASKIQVSKLKGAWLTWMVTIVAGIGFTLLGYDQGVVSGLLTLPSFQQQFPVTANGFEDPRSAVLQSFLVAISKKFSKAGGIIIIGAALQAGSINCATILVSRVINGVGTGFLTSTPPAYQSECAKPERRGQSVLFEGSLITFGIAFAYWLNVAFFFAPGTVSWRIPIAFQVAFVVFMLGCIWYYQAPESPRWLAKKGRHAECLATLAALDNKPIDDAEVLRTFRGICDVLAVEQQGAFALRELLTHGKSQNFRRTAIGVLSQWSQQITGINLITYYLTSVFLIAIAILERAGRRPLMLSMGIAQGLTMAILAGLYSTVEQGNKVAQGFSVLMLFLFNTWFSIGWLGMTWLYPAEVTPLRVRAPANALLTATNWVGNFFVVMVTGPMVANIRWGTYVFFAAMNLFIVVPGTYFLYPETKRYSLEDLDIIFAMGHDQGRNPVWISIEGGIPEAGSSEAERVLGRERQSVDMSEKHGLELKNSQRRGGRGGVGGVGRVMSRSLSGRSGGV